MEDKLNFKPLLLQFRLQVLWTEINLQYKEDCKLFNKGFKFKNRMYSTAEKTKEKTHIIFKAKLQKPTPFHCNLFLLD